MSGPAGCSDSREVLVCPYQAEGSSYANGRQVRKSEIRSCRISSHRTVSGRSCTTLIPRTPCARESYEPPHLPCVRALPVERSDNAIDMAASLSLRQSWRTRRELSRLIAGMFCAWVIEFTKNSSDGRLRSFSDLSSISSSCGSCLQSITFCVQGQPTGSSLTDTLSRLSKRSNPCR